MIYEKDKIKRLIEYKDNYTQGQLKNDLEWILGAYNEYYINSREYEQQRRNYKLIENKYYNSEDEKAVLKEQLIAIKRKYNLLKEENNHSCRNRKNMI